MTRVRVQSFKKGLVTLDIDLRWGGDPDIILAVEALVASLPIQLKDLQVFTIVRVIFQLSEEIPCISAVVVALLSEPKPRIDYVLKAIGGSLTAVPGLSDMIEDTVNSIVSDMLHELELKPQGRIAVTVVKANALKNMEIIGKSDPYAVLYIRPVFKVKTKVINNNLNPVWDETFELIAEDKETQAIIIEVFDEDDLSQDKKLGIVKLPLIELEPEICREFELRLLPSLDMMKVKDKKDRGTITIKVLYHALSKAEQLAALEEEKRTLENKKKLKDAGVVGSTVDALGDAVGGAASLVGTGVSTGAGIVGSGVGAGVGLVGSGFHALSKAGKFMGKTVTNQFSSARRTGSGSVALPDGA
ncbi:hypothetical protein HPP92_014622 [Vanilla planifolia]|uniref:C2 domain-containing protein n=1 Tax=Vanilla planifolia TaxID=51239 RepID=A0A835UU94_VANPL|nr:hypothetical protein HPP92_014622 [Vanilla planifolia]